MGNCFFVSDLHGRLDRFGKLFEMVTAERPRVLFIGGDILPQGTVIAGKKSIGPGNFISDFLHIRLRSLREEMGEPYPRILLIFGNDDQRIYEHSLTYLEEERLCAYIHNRRLSLSGNDIYGYACVPPTPFMLKDWERYDVSRYVDPGCVSPEEGHITVGIPDHERRYGTIKIDLEILTDDNDLSEAIFLFHSPPYKTNLDRSARAGSVFEDVPAEPHVGSIAIRRMIESRQPRITLHGHIHESARISGSWQDKIGRTFCFSAAHDGPELALVRFDIENPRDAARELL